MKFIISFCLVRAALIHFLLDCMGIDLSFSYALTLSRRKKNLTWPSLHTVRSYSCVYKFSLLVFDSNSNLD